MDAILHPTGRPATGHDLNLTFRMPKQVIAVTDKIAKENKTTCADIARQLIIEALAARKKP
jgi:hypothetical protein